MAEIWGSLKESEVSEVSEGGPDIVEVEDDMMETMMKMAGGTRRVN